MAAADTTIGRDRDHRDHSTGHNVRSLSTETKASFKTSEFFAYIAVLAGTLIAGAVITGDGSDPDKFSANEVWLYITVLTFGYMVSRGLAKGGSREPYSDNDH